MNYLIVFTLVGVIDVLARIDKRASVGMSFVVISYMPYLRFERVELQSRLMK